MTVTYRNAIAALLPDFPNVIAVYPDAAWDQATMVYGDNVHLSSRGLIYWTNRLTTEVAKLPFRQGQNFLTSTTSPGYNNPLPSATASYSSGTVDKTTTYTNLKTWVSDANYIYSLGTDLPVLTAGMSIYVTGGTGWTPGTYIITGVNTGFGTPDGTRNMYQTKPFSLNPGFTTTAAAAGTAGGSGRIAN
jgi:hypothetical protein